MGRTILNIRKDISPDKHIIFEAGEVYSISAGLDYLSLGPEHALQKNSKGVVHPCILCGVFYKLLLRRVSKKIQPYIKRRISCLLFFEP